VWIDAWKTDYPRYLELVVPKLTSRGIIVADNLFRGGATLPPASDDEATQGVLEFARRVQENEQLHNVLLTVGDGLLLAWPAPR
jgi:predicted O-methyltransferase YrrM